jgi:MFS family permease
LLTALRFGHGVFAGALIGIGMSVVARMASPERTFALLIFIQLSLGGVGIAGLTPLLGSVGVGAVWLALAAFSLLTLLLLPLLGDYPAPAPAGIASASGRAPLVAIALALLALFAYQAGEMAAFAYMLELGAYYGFDTAFMSLAVAVSLWIGAPATLLVAWWSTRSGRLRPILLGVSGTTAVVALLLVPAPAAFAIANAGFGIFFAIAIPYLLGLVSEMDNGGRMAAVGGFANSLGLATGPAVAAALVGGGELTRAPLLGVGLLMLSLLLALAPARALDRASPHSRVEW